jgi:hypothetical protein
MIIRSYSNIDIIQGVIGYGNATEGITDWRIENTGAGIFNINNSSSIITPSGGTTEIGQITNSSDRYMIFKGGTSTFTVPAGGIVCDILVVGGGGGGGKRHGGGGGAGTLLYHKNITLNGTYTVKVGAGGTGVPSTGFQSGNTVLATSGNFSQFINIDGSQEYYANGGGRGGGWSINAPVITNGGRTLNDPDTTLPLTNKFNGITVSVSNKQYVNTLPSPEGCRGNVGGIQVSNYKGGGGGGAGGVGMNHDAENTVNDGYGGIGLAIDITGTSVVYAGGGNGSDFEGSVSQVFDPSYPTIQSRGGGGYGSDNGTPQNGLDGTGGGGGAQGNDSNGNPSGNGGSGIVIIRYSTTNISIIDNGNVGIGTTPISSSSKLEIYGGVNITGIYKKNNRDIITDTSNYVLTTSNAIVSRTILETGHGSNYFGRLATQLNTRVGNTSNYIANISSGLSSGATSSVNSQWTDVSSGIHYTPTTTSLNIISTPIATTTGTTGDYTYMTFTYTTETAGAGTGQTLYTINVPTGGMVCDILIVGGGGGGGNGDGSSNEPGGGGAGGIVYMVNKTLNTGSYKVNVGNGGSANTNGSNSSITNNNNNSLTFDSILLIGRGGGKGATTSSQTGSDGGSGGGGGHNQTNGGIATQGNTFWNGTSYVAGGFNGGRASASSRAGGGGGAGEVGSTDGEGFGGDGRQVSITGTATFYAGGGNGYNNPSTTRSDGGGGTLNGGLGVQNGGNALPNTGSGGSGAYGGSPYIGGSGGSGIVIIRFLSSTRNVGIGTTYPTSELHVFDDTTTNTKLTVQNNNAGNPDIVITPSTGFTNVVTRSGTPTKTYITYTFSINLDNLIAYYKFNGNYNDNNPSTTKYNLTATGAPDFISSETNFIQDSSVYLNANGEFLATSVNFPNTFGTSYSFWFKRNNNSTHDMLFAIGVDFFLIAHTNNVFYFSNTVGGSETYGQPSITWVNNFWYHCVFIFLSDGTWKLYINGNEIIFTTLGGNYPFTVANGKMPTGKLYIGGKNVGYWTSNDLDGYIDEFYVFSKVLTQTEIINLYNKNYTVPTNIWNVKFPTSSAVTINSGSSQNVIGNYTVSVGNNSSVIPADGQATTPYPSTAITSIAIVYEYNKTILPEVITTASGTTSRRIGDTDMCTTFTYAGSGSSTTYTFTTTEAYICDILVIGGGGGAASGGGGAGGYVYLTNISLSSGTSYTVTVGNGGAGSTGSTSGTQGTNSSFIGGSLSYTAFGGGGGGGNGNQAPAHTTGQVGSYGGTGMDFNQAQTYTSTQGNRGGNPSTTAYGSGGGGGGASEIGGNPIYVSGVRAGTTSSVADQYSNGGIGGNGILNNITGAAIYYAGGGTGGANTNNETNTAPQIAPLGGGGLGSRAHTATGGNGTDGLGGGGGGGDWERTISSGKGGSGIVIIRYRRINSASFELITAKQLPNELIVSGTSSTSTGTFDRCIVFPYTTETISGSGQTQYNFSINEEIICDILVVAGGGGGGGRNAGGGGAGGLVLVQNITLFGNFTINVGRGGSGRTGDNSGLPGINSTLTKSDNTIIITANGGGRGGNTFDIGGNGGSGGGGGFIYSNGTQTQKSQSQIGIVSPTILNQYGENGGHGGSGVGNSYPGGGGGGAGGVGATSPGDETGQNGGLGIDRVGEFIFKEKFNSSVGDYGWFAGGGASAGGYQNTNYAYGNGGASMFGGGGNGDGVGRGINGINGTGGGGGGIRYSDTVQAGNGGSGIVIIRYRSTKIGYQGYNIGNYNGDFKIISTNSSTNTDFMRITRDGASIYNPTGSPLWSTVSDRRIKENIEIASYDKCYESINKLELYRFNYIKELNNINKDIVQLGYIAQEVKDIFPKAISTQEFYNENLSISDMLSIDVTQINYSLYGAVKKLIEIDNNKEMRIKMIEYLLDIDTASNITIDTTTTSNLTLDTSTTSNITVDTTTSNLILDTTTSNLTLDTAITSNLTIDTAITSNLTIDASITSNLTLDTSITSNIILDTTTSNLSN